MTKSIPYKILLIEDDLECACKIIDWFENTAQITHVRDEVSAAAKAQVDMWSLVITDFKHPDLNDLDITRLVKLTNQHTPVLIVTAHQKVDFIITALQNHADGFLFKPLDKNQFLSLALKLVQEGVVKRNKESKVILAIGAHPDDVEIGCGGSLALHRAKGDHLNILTLSMGELGGKASHRKKEAQNAAELLGAQLFLEKLVDTKISDAAFTIGIIENIVQQIKPTHVYTHSIYDGHQDHRNVYHATVTACRQIPNLYCYQSPSSTVDFKPNLFIEISDFIEKKLEVIALYKSQIDKRPYLHQDMVRATARYWGRFSNYGHAEPLEVIRQQYL